MRGRVALLTDDGRGGQASMLWQHEADRHTLLLRGPFGGSLLRIQQDRNGAELQDAKNNRRRAASSEELLFDATGWRMPLSGLEYWVLGIPVPDQVARQAWDESGRLKSLRQLGWEVYYIEYSSSGAYDLPSRIDLISPATEQLSRIEARIVVDEWVIN
jgi:outer membrane lipoprotein LolB